MVTEYSNLFLRNHRIRLVNTMDVTILVCLHRIRVLFLRVRVRMGRHSNIRTTIWVHAGNEMVKITCVWIHWGFLDNVPCHGKDIWRIPTQITSENYFFCHLYLTQKSFISEKYTVLFSVFFYDDFPTFYPLCKHFIQNRKCVSNGGKCRLFHSPY